MDLYDDDLECRTSRMMASTDTTCQTRGQLDNNMLKYNSNPNVQPFDCHIETRVIANSCRPWPYNDESNSNSIDRGALSSVSLGSSDISMMPSSGLLSHLSNQNIINSRDDDHDDDDITNFHNDNLQQQSIPDTQLDLLLNMESQQLKNFDDYTLEEDDDEFNGSRVPQDTAKRAATDMEIEDNEIDGENSEGVEEFDDDYFQGQLGTQPQPRETIIERIEQVVHELLQRIVLQKAPLGFPGFVASPSPKQTYQSKRMRNTESEATTSLASTSDYTDSLNKRDHQQANTSSGSTSICSTAATSNSSRASIKRKSQASDNARSIKTFGTYKLSITARRLKVLEIIHESISNNVVVSKRDIYYRDVTLFTNQTVVDTIVNGWSRYFNVPRSSLNVTASSKGLIFGAAYITLKNNKAIDCTADVNTDDSYCSDEQGVLIPPVNQIANVVCVAEFVLVIEKEASFRHLVSTGFSKMFPNGILITGRGYPDIATRHFLKYLATENRKLQILALVDYDPYGLDIYAVYKWGGRLQAFDAPNLAVPKIQLVGLTKKDRLKFDIPDSAFGNLTDRDRSKALSMIIHYSTKTSNNGNTATQLQYSLANRAVHAPSSCSPFVREVSTMLHLNLKCELQALSVGSQFGMISYLQSKVSSRLLASNSIITANATHTAK
ncbi:Spo11/DNA topoisomerase VI subunit A [Zychaea mexicana]|uniref:Spo11/DNA topoisomerase VI subunit A n=1 Tax=Zychaea mexicana TaxID=64656 RepID=UPI0022FE59AB|nr:Spo11/DNA topoisomerase VI subunit A [Zychaea mexicana]KAI9488436.1 Spo11/DNA topoisomerase VI subunit A [Zychaea mexicana]